MRKINTHEWVAVVVALTVVSYLIIEGVFGNVFKPADDHSLVALNSNTEHMTDENKTVLPGLTIEVLQEGQGTRTVRAQDEITVDYTGKLLDGTVFDSSIPRGQPFTFVIGQGSVIEGWEEGLIGMKIGEKRRLTIAPEKAYGAAMGHRLQHETLIFDVELHDIQ